MADYIARIGVSSLAGQTTSGEGYNDRLLDQDKKILECIKGTNAVNDALTNHKNDKSNPHKVTASQIGAAVKTDVDEQISNLSASALTQKGTLDNADLNTIKENSVYYLSTNRTYTNAPNGVTSGMLIATNRNNVTIQMLYATAQNKMYIRRNTSSTSENWNEWESFVNQRDLDAEKADTEVLFDPLVSNNWSSSNCTRRIEGTTITITSSADNKSAQIYKEIPCAGIKQISVSVGDSFSTVTPQLRWRYKNVDSTSVAGGSYIPASNATSVIDINPEWQSVYLYAYVGPSTETKKGDYATFDKLTVKEVKPIDAYVPANSKSAIDYEARNAIAQLYAMLTAQSPQVTSEGGDI